MPRVALIISLLGIAALVAVITLAGGRDARHETLFERVASDPERYRDREVLVTGRVQARSNRLPDAFALRGPQGRRLLVVAGAAAIPPVQIGMRVAVRGVLVPLDPRADERVEERPHVVALGDVAARMDAVAVLRATVVSPRASG